jgi:RND family efflux transporter MFP subunit
MPGTVTRILAEIGQEVKAGQVLAEMDKESIAKGIDEVKNQLTFATDIFNRQQALWNQKIGSEIQFLQAKNNKESLEKRLVSLNEQLDMALIKAPISGVVDEVYARIGQPASPGAPSFRVVNFSNLKARAEVAEVNANKVKKGNSVLVIFPDIQDSVNGQISYASKVISPMTRTFFVEVPLKNGKVDYKPNSIAILKVSDYSNPKAITVPIRLVQNAEDGMYVLVAEEKDGKIVASKRVVTLGTSYNGVAEVKSGLAIGDKLINAGYQSVNVGDLLKVN